MIEAKTARSSKNKTKPARPLQREEILHDFYICCLSREASILARKEVLTGRANFGIIGDGKEVAQVAMAKAWRKGDFRSGYYRDQTLMLALGVTNLDEFFSQLYGDPNNDPFSGGRQMNCHFATPMVNADGEWLDHKNTYNTSSDIAPTAGQMARGLGLAFASKKFRENPEICGELSDNGNEVCFLTIGDASTSEGPFWETINAAGVIQAPLAINVWDDGYGISVPQKYQTTKENISGILAGFQAEGNSNGLDIYTGKAWDYEGLCNLYTSAIERMRQSHRPALFHIQEVTQQLGHSTSGDHRRYKSPERLAWEEAYDCNRRMEQWMLENGHANATEIAEIKSRAKKEVAEASARAFNAYHETVAVLRHALESAMDQCLNEVQDNGLQALRQELRDKRNPLRYELLVLARRAQLQLAGRGQAGAQALKAFIQSEQSEGDRIYSDYLYSQSPKSPLKVPVVAAAFSDNSPMKDGYEVLNACFDAIFKRYPQAFAFGEDVGFIGDVNQGMRGMQAAYGESRVFDTGIREWTIMGQAIGMAMRGQRPIAEIQYLDYLLYGLAPLSDDLCTLRWRTNNLQAAPAIIRTRGHRLVGVWHAGSPMGMMLGSLRGMWICVPRNMTQAAGMYNTLLQGDDPAIVVEALNGYRLKEKLPDNIGSFTVPLGVPEVLLPGTDLSLITYGSCVRVAEQAAHLLKAFGISVELIDVQTLLPFDLPETCLQSIRKTNRVVVLDEDFEGGATGFMLQQILEKQGAYKFLDAAPLTIAAKPHRPGYGQDGDYHSKPQAEDVAEKIYQMMRESDPARFAAL
ncbi:MAG: transketolase [Chitinophagales bacterium]|nr:transketolase [Chitinophagales bacterium]